VSGQLQAQADLLSGKSSRLSTEQKARLAPEQHFTQTFDTEGLLSSGRPTGLWRYIRRTEEETFTFKVIVSAFLRPFIPLNQFISA
jgi:hypothetical protein